jgi:polysaccharide biosynthesis transport protein
VDDRSVRRRAFAPAGCQRRGTNCPYTSDKRSNADRGESELGALVMDMRAKISSGPRFAILDDQPHSGQDRGTTETVRTYDIKQAFDRIRRRAAIIVISVAIGGLLSLVAAFVIKPTYTATALLAVSAADDGDANRNGDVSVDTQIAMLQSPVFLQRAFEAISRDNHLRDAIPRSIDLERHLKVLQQLRSRLIAVTFTATSASDAAGIANKIARLYVEDPFLQSAESVDDASATLSQQMAKLEEELQRVESREPAVKASSPETAASAEASDLRDQVAALKLRQSLARRREENRQQALTMSPPVQLVALAEPPSRPSSLNPILMFIPAMILSVIFGVVLALLLGKLDKRIYLPADIIENFSFPYAGAIPARRRRDNSGANPNLSTSAGYSRAIDALVTNTLLVERANRRTLLITTGEDDREASEIALNFACAAARLGRRVVLIDMYTRRGFRRTWRKPESNTKLDVFDVLSKRCSPTTAIQCLTGTGLDYLPSRDEDDTDTLPLIANGQLQELITELRASYDWVILRGPPVIGCSDTSLVATAVDAAILIVRSGRSTFPDVKNALDTLGSSMSPEAFGEPSSNIFTVLADAPRQSLPAPYRDGRFLRRTIQLNPSADVPALSTAETILKRPSASSSQDCGDSRRIPSHG